jgi:hypothetical protein
MNGGESKRKGGVNVESLNGVRASRERSSPALLLIALVNHWETRGRAFLFVNRRAIWSTMAACPVHRELYNIASTRRIA